MVIARKPNGNNPKVNAQKVLPTTKLKVKKVVTKVETNLMRLKKTSPHLAKKIEAVAALEKKNMAKIGANNKAQPKLKITKPRTCKTSYNQKVYNSKSANPKINNIKKVKGLLIQKEMMSFSIIVM